MWHYFVKVAFIYSMDDQFYSWGRARRNSLTHASEDVCESSLQHYFAAKTLEKTQMPINARKKK